MLGCESGAGCHRVTAFLGQLGPLAAVLRGDGLWCYCKLHLDVKSTCLLGRVEQMSPPPQLAMLHCCLRLKHHQSGEGGTPKCTHLEDVVQ